MKSFIVAALLIIALTTVECNGLMGNGIGPIGLGYGIGPKAAVGPNILYGGYTLTSHSVSGPLNPGLYKTSFIPGKVIY